MPRGLAGRNRAIANIRANAIRRGYEWSLTDEHVIGLMGSGCDYCGAAPSQVSRARNGDFLYNGIDRVDNAAGYVVGNVVACCGDCNMAKLGKSRDEFLKWAAAVYSHSLGGM